ncbi:MAG: SDR family NAD(P)-dependent oxidoreductase [Suipraeoptans sp.]
MFKDKVVIVLGATSGIGISIAEAFAGQGAKTVVVGRNMERGIKVVDKITMRGDEATFIQCDITDEVSIKDLMEKAVEKYGRIDILIGNAGIPEKKVPIDEMTDEDFRDFMAVINTDLVGIIQTNRYAMKYMLKNEGENKGNIVNIASILGVVADYDTASYPASKAGIINFTKAQAVSYIKKGIRMNVVSPGYVRTPLLDQLPKELIAMVVDKHPIGRFAEPEEIADAVLFLASENSKYIVGHNLVVDGGYTAI